MSRPALLLTALVVLGLGAGGYLAGDSAQAEKEDEAREARAAARQSEVKRLEKDACEEARERGYRAGLVIGRRTGRRTGARDGRRRAQVVLRRRRARLATPTPEPPVVIPGSCPPTHQGCTFSHSEPTPKGTRCVYSCGVAPFGSP